MTTSKRLKRIMRLHQLRDQAAEWAAQHHEAELAAGIAAWMGHLSPSQPLFLNGVAFALLITPDDGRPSLMERFAASRSSWPRAERRILQSQREASAHLVEVRDVTPGEEVVVEDVFSNRLIRLQEASASQSLQRGNWLVCIIARYERRFELEGTVAIVPDLARVEVVRAMRSRGTALGFAMDKLSPADSRRLLVPAIRVVRHHSRRPCLVNGEGHDVVVHEVTFDIPLHEARRHLAHWPDTFDDEDTVRWLGGEDEARGGPVLRGTWVEDGLHTQFQCNSAERLAEMVALWNERCDRPLVELDRTVERPESDPLGPKLVFDVAVSSYSEEIGSEEAIREQALEDARTQWWDTPVPALDGRTPRQDHDAGGSVELRALLAMHARVAE